ncbi:hypothetical protein NSS70_10555 [Aeribacillus sp. FSL K6-2848]|uniref:hypothetical protein n=1 Tax=Aeribacillus sp. FSL K6-2848 TaxID=2954612 RepID=UPI0030F7F326
MRIDQEEHFRREVIGAINTYIRMINESDKWDPVGLGIIDNVWNSHLEDNGDTFVATLNIKGNKEKIYFKKDDWKSFNANMMANQQLQNLFNRFSRGDYNKLNQKSI